MTPLTLHSFALDKSGRTATLSLKQGESLAVVGPGGSGKSRFLSACVGEESPARGTAETSGEVAIASPPSGRRLKPQSIAQPGKGASRADRAAAALTATNLWDARQTPLSDLSPSQLAACELLALLAGSANLLAIDGQLDFLDPWALSGVLDLLRKRMADGATVVVATNRLDLLLEFDWLVVLKSSKIVYAGLTSDLRKLAGEEAVVVETANQVAVKAIGHSFQIDAEETDAGVVLRAPDGQELAARLLLQGYGDVRSVLLKKPDPSEAVRRLIEGN